MRVLLIGANGQVGKSLVQKLEGKCDLNALDRYKLDVTDKDKVISLVSLYKPDVVINASAYNAVDKAEDEIDVAFSVNKMGPAYLAEASDLVGAIFFHISTDYVFDGTSKSPYKETDLPVPLGVYGKSKLAGEAAALKLNRKTFILRTSWVFSEYGNNFLKTILRAAKTRDSLSVVADQVGSPTYAGDIADAIITMVNSVLHSEDLNIFGIYHFSGEPYVSWAQFAKSIFNMAEKQRILGHISVLDITSAEYPTKATRPMNSKLCCEKIQSIFGIKASQWKEELQTLEKYLDY
ncbi:dTDP-4-dehydrorhamnose reductase [Vibrio algivorus]|uniref:dTDP-4-dehydrorhamnose reductase n=1 Tax=Vibrio algivorus TaxID=1667024 RepID=A0ABQ6EK32_9VIBR|nr:dTDP-4-dehydrorhamnose reductase [Vibrio algivorus]GLT13174.1 NAD(P)-dependent oxidoreductase [Vibrio algivorus]